MTFSLAGRCARTGMMGAAITTSSVGVGARCMFARAGVGVVLTQHRTDPRLGPLGLAMLEAGLDAAQAVAGLAAGTPHAGWRQLAAVDAAGRTGHFSGALIRSKQAGVSGVDCVAVGNILRNTEVPGAMVAAFEADPAMDLAERLLAALEAGNRAGGEERPLRSAAVLVVHRERFPYVDLRVDAAAEPIAALRAVWAEYAPEVDEYVARAVDPGSLGASSL